MPTPGSSSIPPSFIDTHGTHSDYLAIIDQRSPSDTTLTKATQSDSPRLYRSNIRANNFEICNFE